MVKNASNKTTTIVDMMTAMNTSDLVQDVNFFMKCKYLQSMEVYYNNIISDYRDYFDELLEEIDLDPKYHYQPMKFAEDTYGTPDLYFMVLYFANLTSLLDFNVPKIKILPASKIDIFLKLLTKYKNDIKANRESPDVFNQLPKLSEGVQKAVIEQKVEMKNINSK
jgi:hypothetical protein